MPDIVKQNQEHTQRGQDTTLAPQYSLDELMRMAQIVAKSGLFPAKRPEEAAVLMLQAQADGTHPMRAIAEYHIIQGRPALRADAMLARFQNAGGKVEWKELSDERVVATFSHPQGGSVTIEWTIDMAKRAGLVKPNSGWTKYPRAMLRSRVVSEGVRTVFPGVAVGVYTPEEVSDFDDGPRTVEATVASTTPAPPEADREPQRVTSEQLRRIAAAMDAVGLTGDDARQIRLELSRLAVGRELSVATELTQDEAEALVAYLERLRSALEGAGVRSPEEAAAYIAANVEAGELPPDNADDLRADLEALRAAIE